MLSPRQPAAPVNHPPVRIWQRYALVSVLLLAVLLRLLAVAVVQVQHPSGPETYEHGEIAARLLAGEGFSITFLGTTGPTSQQAPLYPFLLAALYAVWGVHSPAALLVMQLLQVVAGTGTVYLVWRLGRTWAPNSVAIAGFAALLAAIHPTHIYAVTHIQVVVWAMLIVTGLFCWISELAARARDQQTNVLTWNTAGGLGALCGVLLLVDPILALLLPVFALALLVQACWPTSLATWRTGLLRCGTVALVAGLVIAPWLVRNRVVHGEWVFIKSTFGYAFWQGNHPASWGTDKIPKASAATLAAAHDGTWAAQHKALWEARHETLYIDDVLLKPHGYAQFAGLSEPARSRILQAEVCQAIVANPTSYAQKCVKRLWYFWIFDETNPKAAHPLYRATTVVWLVLGSIGALLAWPERARWWPLFAACAVLTVFHALTITSVRFRLPLEPATLVWCGLTLGAVWHRFRPTLKETAVRFPLTAIHRVLQGPHTRAQTPQRKGRTAGRSSRRAMTVRRGRD